MYKKWIKRLLDILLSLCLLIVLSPVLLTLAVLVRVRLGSPVLFTQERPGYGEKIFTLYKFPHHDGRAGRGGESFAGQREADVLREIPEGFQFGRAAGIFQYPERGYELHLGPRPLLVSYLPYYTKEEALRHTVRPGLTGLAQVCGRNFSGLGSSA